MDIVNGTIKDKNCTYCMYYFPENIVYRCEAPIGINRLCMKQFREWKETDQYKQWETKYFDEMKKYMV